MILLLPVDGAERPAEGGHELRRDYGCLPAIDGAHLDSGHRRSESRELLRAVQRDEGVGVVVLVHAGGKNSGDLELFELGDESARRRVHPGTRGRHQADRVAWPLVESRSQELAEDKAAALAYRAGETKVSG